MAYNFNGEIFEWDEDKARANLRKHGVLFEWACELFAVEERLDLVDVDHSSEEDRFISIGEVRQSLLYVVWTERLPDRIRIISARRATARERMLFGHYMWSLR